MDINDLIEMRKKIVSYKRTGAKQIRSILKQLQLVSLSHDQLEQSKIHKTLYNLSKIDIEDDDCDISQSDLKFIRDMARSLVDQFKVILNKSNRKDSAISNTSNISNLSNQIVHNHKSDDQTKSQNDEQQKIQQNKSNLIFKGSSDLTRELIKDLCLPQTIDPNRIKVIDRLLSIMMKGMSSNTLLKYLKPYTFADISRKLEHEAFNNKQQYQNNIKDMLKYMERDSDGSVRSRLLKGIISPQRAALLRTEDWICDQKLKECRENQQEQVKAGDMQHFKRIAMEINKDVKLNKCSHCSEDQLKLVDEKQTRAADEPSTKFWECLSCGYSEITN